jgi:hypothetical protein
MDVAVAVHGEVGEHLDAPLAADHTRRDLSIAVDDTNVADESDGDVHAIRVHLSTIGEWAFTRRKAPQS